jgi:hypothetical protein
MSIGESDLLNLIGTTNNNHRRKSIKHSSTDRDYPHNTFTVRVDRALYPKPAPAAGARRRGVRANDFRHAPGIVQGYQVGLWGFEF